MSKIAAHKSTPLDFKGENKSASGQKSPTVVFIAAALDMSWRLAIAVLAPVIGGAELDKHFGGKHLWVFVGLGLAFVASSLVVWRTVQSANRLPVPKLTAAQRRAIQKSYEEDDE